MNKAPAQILKNTRLNQSNQYQVTPSPKSNLAKSAGISSARAEIVSKDENFIMIKVVCNCGEVIKLRCSTQEN